MRTIRVQNVETPKAVKSKGLVKESKQFKKTSFIQERKYFAWAKVTKRRSSDCTVDVVLDTGIELKHVNVRSSEWAGVGASDGFGERDLPPADALVLIVFPYGTLEDALVLCSAFSLFGNAAQKQKSNILVSGKEDERYRKTESGTVFTEDKSTGDMKVELPSGAKLELVANGATIEITASGGVKMVPASGQTFEASVNGAKIEITAAGGVNITPATGQSIVLNGGTQGANDLPNCLFTGTPHCLDVLQTVKVP